MLDCPLIGQTVVTRLKLGANEAGQSLLAHMRSDALEKVALSYRRAGRKVQDEVERI